MRLRSLLHSAAALFITAAGCFVLPCFGQNRLYIPDTLSGTTFNLNVQTGTKEFFAGKSTPTYGYNGNYLGPTLLINKGEKITLNVTNKLSQPTTVHWHGFHVAPENDGGPHQIIAPNTTWSPSFNMLNEAATFWYHPHGEAKTEIQIGRGLAGMIIVRDTTEAALALPRKYGLDDFPLIIQSKAFDVFQQIATANHEDSIMMVNGTIKPYLQVPQQVVRLRLLNASADRTYYLGLSDNSNFSLIASDGGLLAQPYETNRVRLSTGERVEILVDFGKYSLDQQLYLKSYASELPKGIIGADSVGTASIMMGEGYYENPLNGADFNILRFDITSPTANAITSIPTTLVNRTALSPSSANATHTLLFEPDTITSGEEGYVDGPFLMNKASFHMDSVNYVSYLNNIEVWTLVNKTLVAHPFHIHDIQFYVIDINGSPAPAQYAGLKDVILVQPNDTLRFITKFETFANPHIPYMYHCHLLHHEDEGMMGSFLVVDTTTSGINEAKTIEQRLLIYPNPSTSSIQIQVDGSKTLPISIYNSLGKLIKHYPQSVGEIFYQDVSTWNPGWYTVRVGQNVGRFLIISN